MRTLYAITTLGRCADQRTLVRLTPEIRDRLVLVVQEHEYQEHYDMWSPHVMGVVALPPEINKLGATRRWVYETARDSGFDAVVMMDDDLDFLIREDPEDWPLTATTPEQLNQMFREVEEKLAEGYMHVSVSGREGNNRTMSYGEECVRYMRLLAYRTNHARCIEHGRIDGMSDFDVNLQLLRAGCPSYVFYRYAQGQPGTQTAGGISSDRTHEKHEREVDFMVREHGPFVSKRLKVNKSGGDFGTRHEVTVMWKNVYEASQT